MKKEKEIEELKKTIEELKKENMLLCNQNKLLLEREKDYKRQIKAFDAVRTEYETCIAETKKMKELSCRTIADMKAMKKQYTEKVNEMLESMRKTKKSLN